MEEKKPDNIVWDKENGENLYADCESAWCSKQIRHSEAIQCADKILNLKSEMRGVCSCKTRFLRFARSE